MSVAMTFSNRFNRRTFLANSVAVSIANSFLWTPAAKAQMPMPDSAGTPLSTLEKTLDRYVAAYMAAMNAPGLTLGLTDARQTLRTAGYGFANVDRREAVSADHLYQIGSITKSFTALVVLQLHDEGKLDLHKPILDYLPWLPISEQFGRIASHHLLTHSAGLPDNLGVFSSDPTAKLVQAYKPGEHFHYCNAGFDILGMLIAKLDGRSWREAVQARIFNPLGMHDTRGVITTADRDRFATGYQPFMDDEVYPRLGRLVTAPWLVMDDTAGCIASTPGDMATYARMLINRGLKDGSRPERGRIVSEDSFTLFSTGYIKAEEFSPTASYGYGIAVDTLEGHKILRHTGGMVAYASSLHVDLDAGVAAFASINAMQGYRPTAVTEYAIRLLRADAEAKPLPRAPALTDPDAIDSAQDYAGTFTAPDGSTFEFYTHGKQLLLASPGYEMGEGHQHSPIPLQHIGGDDFICADGRREYSRYAFSFERQTLEAASTGAAEAKPGPVVAVTYGPNWYANKVYTGPKSWKVPEEFAALTGYYRSENPWGTDARVWILKDKLIASGTPMTPISGNLFRLGEEPWTPDTAEFSAIAGGKARLLKMVGIDFWRVEVD
jgi:D-alanyl-D-alanine carboxypeptidase